MTSKQNAISLFSGMGGDTLGIHNAGLNVLAFNEFDKAATDCHKLNFPNSTLICDLSQKKTKDQTNIQLISDSIFSEYKDKVDLIFAGHPCFVTDTKVLTNNGYKLIQDVDLNDKLLTHLGNFQNIVNLQNKLYSGNIFTFRIKYHPENIKSTDNHPFYVREKIKKWNQKIKNYDISYEKPIWKYAKDITSNDYFGMIINSNQIIPEFSFNKIVNSNRTDNIKIIIDKPEYWFMMGYFIGDGWIQDSVKSDGRSKNCIYFAINDNDIDDIVRNISLVIPITDKKSDSGKSKKYGCSNFIWFNILKKFGKYAHNKIIPEWVQDAPIDMIQHFIEGYRRADGCIKKK